MRRLTYILVGMLVRRHRGGGKRRSRNPEGTRSLLLQAAFREVSRLGFEGAGLNTILAETGVTKGALYYHSRCFAEGPVGRYGPPRPRCPRDCQLPDRDVRGLCHVGQERPRCECVQGRDQKYRWVARLSSRAKEAHRLRWGLRVKWNLKSAGSHG